MSVLCESKSSRLIAVVPGIVLLNALATMALLVGVANKTATAITSHTSHKSLRSHSTQAPKQRACTVLLKKASYRGDYNLLNVVGDATGTGSVEDKGVRVIDKELNA